MLFWALISSLQRGELRQFRNYSKTKAPLMMPQNIDRLALSSYQQSYLIQFSQHIFGSGSRHRIRKRLIRTNVVVQIMSSSYAALFNVRSYTKTNCLSQQLILMVRLTESPVQLSFVNFVYLVLDQYSPHAQRPYICQLTT